MLTIPAIDLIGGSCVRLYKGDYRKQTTYSDDPAAQAVKFQDAGFQRVHVIDLEGAKEGTGKNREAIRQVAAAVNVPVQVGGGIRTLDDVRELLDSGVSYLILGTVVLKQPDLVSEWVEAVGGDKFIVSLDLRAGKLQSEGWLEESEQPVAEVLARIIDWDMRQVICTDVEKDGTLEQPNWATYRSLLKQLPEEVDLIAAGGICRPEHITRLGEIGLAGAVVGRALYEGEFTWEEMLRAG